MNKTARRVIDYCIDNDIGILVVGYNETLEREYIVDSIERQWTSSECRCKWCIKYPA